MPERIPGLEERMRLMEAQARVHELQLRELEDWRRRDEPRVQELATANQVANEVRRALREQHRRQWTWGQRAGAFLVGLLVVADSIVTLLQGIGRL